MDDLYFEGDPDKDSTRRHMERVLAEPARPRRWPWVAAAMAGMAAFGVWHFRRRNSRESEDAEPSPRSTVPATAGSAGGDAEAWAADRTVRR